MGALVPVLGTAEQPYSYSGLSFNKGMNPSAGPFFVGDGAIDVINGLWDVSGFVYPRNAFKLFNGRTRILGNREIGGMYRYVRRTEPPFFSAQSSFLVAESLTIFQDSSITDSSLAFKKEAIGIQRGTINVNSNSLVLNNTGAKFIEAVYPIDQFFSMLDSTTIFRDSIFAGKFCYMPLNNDSLWVNGGTQRTAANTSNWKLLPSFDPASQKFFAQMRNMIIFGDSTKPTWQWDGTYTKVNYLADSGRIYSAVNSPLLRDGSKAWFPNQWRGFWLKFGRTPYDTSISDFVTCFVPITGNDDTSLTLKYTPTGLGTVGSEWYILSIPVERRSPEKTITSASTTFIRPTEGVTFKTGTGKLLCYPLQVFITSGPGAGELRVVRDIHNDTLFFGLDPFKVAPTTASKFVYLSNYPIISKTITVHQDRLWYIGDMINKNRIYYSEPLLPSVVGPFNYLDVFPRDGDALTSAASYNDELLCYKNNSVARVVGDNPSNFVVMPFLENLGTPGINTRTSFGGEEYFYDYRSGIYVIREFNPVRLSEPVKPLLDSVPSASAKNAALTYFNNHLWFAYPAGSNQTKNNRLLTYNIRLQEPTWSRQTFNKIANFCVWPLAGDSTRLTVGDPDSGLVYVYNDTARIDAYQTNRIKLTYKTGWMPLSTPEFRKQLRGFQLAFRQDTTTDIDSTFFYNDLSTAPFDTLLFTQNGQADNYIAKDINRNGIGRLFQLEMRIAPRGSFKLYVARYKWANVGEQQ